MHEDDPFEIVRMEGDRADVVGGGVGFDVDRQDP